MSTIFYKSPAEYRAETAAFSKIWWIYVPAAVALGLWVFSALGGSFYKVYFESELGVLEFLHAALPLAAAVIAFRLLFVRELQADPLIWAWVALFAIGCVYLGGEEASWGQHYFGWSTPEGWAEINKQQETNLHNTGFWFDKLPRVVISLVIIFGGFFLPLLKAFGWIRIWPRIDIIVPALWMSGITGLFAAFELYSVLQTYIQPLKIVKTFRMGEMEENYIAPIVFLYAISLRNRVREIATERQEKSLSEHA